MADDAERGAGIWISAVPIMAGPNKARLQDETQPKNCQLRLAEPPASQSKTLTFVSLNGKLDIGSVNAQNSRDAKPVTQLSLYETYNSYTSASNLSFDVVKVS